MAHCVQTKRAMTATEELAAIDAQWDTDPPNSGTFGHASERRLGLRVPATCWALLRHGAESVYAQTIELSPTGAVLKLLDGKATRFDHAQRFTLDIFVPGATQPVHATVRPARAVGQLEAFEFSAMSAADRLTLAEHLDRLAAPRRSVPATVEARAATPVSWKNFVLSLRPRSKPIPVQRF